MTSMMETNKQGKRPADAKPTNDKRETTSIERGPDGVKADTQTRAWLKRMGY